MKENDIAVVCTTFPNTKPVLSLEKVFSDKVTISLKLRVSSFTFSVHSVLKRNGKGLNKIRAKKKWDEWKAEPARAWVRRKSRSMSYFLLAWKDIRSFCMSELEFVFNYVRITELIVNCELTKWTNLIERYKAYLRKVMWMFNNAWCAECIVWPSWLGGFVYHPRSIYRTCSSGMSYLVEIGR